MIKLRGSLTISNNLTNVSVLSACSNHELTNFYYVPLIIGPETETIGTRLVNAT